ncbi:hypothetical protein EIP91_002973 [Steccherinum ochraceum]|uniref:Uncharacterized protein n=1 Tax=Steccherinum ochraceum TaxID=92696 RepID=A0A4R0RDR6_9APHY|nr:hypothetical protein EIP91_002973 [Steccherinum ochraceum]
MADVLQNEASFSVDVATTYLQTLLEDKENQLQQAGALGQQLLSQQTELEERVKQLQDLAPATGAMEDARDRYRDLTEMVNRWDAENKALLASLTAEKGVPADPAVGAPASSDVSSSADSAEPAIQPSRARARNSRQHDTEFAFEIGSGLLTEVRRLQSLLAERDKEVQDLKEDNAGLRKFSSETQSHPEGESQIDSVAEHARQSTQYAEAVKQIAQLQTQITEQEKDLALLRQQAVDSRKTITQLQDEVTDSDKKNLQVQKEAEQLEATISALQDDKNRQAETLDSADAQVRFQEKEIRLLHEQVVGLTRELSEAKNQADVRMTHMKERNTHLTQTLLVINRAIECLPGGLSGSPS